MDVHLLAQTPVGFNWIDWGVVAGYLVLTTVLGARLAGKQATIRDFFLGGRKLPWWAVCGSTIATEVSTATFLVVPTLSFAAGGNLTYLQFAIGSIIARVIVGLYFVPRFYEREIYSPYDYVGNRLGRRVKTVTTGLFLIGAILGQGARLYTSAFALAIVANVPLSTAIWLMGGFSVLWAMIGGITMVIWTDVIQFVILMTGAAVALGYAVLSIPAPLADVVSMASEAGKFQILNLSTDLSVPYTLWAGLLAIPFTNLAAFGTDQVNAQRMFCCRNQGDAAKSMIVSSVGISIALIMLLVGIALHAYFQYSPFTPEEAARYNEKPTYLLPIFIVRALPIGVRGIIVAAIFAAAVSTLESVLAALAQTTSEPFLKRFAKPRGRGAWWRGEVAISKILVLAWGVVLCGMAMLSIEMDKRYENTIDFVLALASYTAGPLLGIFLLAFLPNPPGDRGLPWAVPLAVLAVFAMLQRDIPLTLPAGLTVNFADWVVWMGCLIALSLGLLRLHGDVRKVSALTFAVIAIVGLHLWQVGVDDLGRPKYPAYPWSYPVGPLFTFGLGYVLGQADAPRAKATPRRKRA